MIVCKFGGAALADAAGFRQAEAIARANTDRRVLVVSAPGRRGPADEKITDLLYACQSEAKAGRGFGHLFDRVAARFREIADALGLPAPDAALRQVYQGLRDGGTPDWAASRGEWLCAQLLAARLDVPMVDAARAVRFDESGRLLKKETLAALAKIETPCVLPGFYGADRQGKIHAFPRGGSDVTAALCAAALNADVYENWKDVRGVAAADPAIVPDARRVPAMTYRELRALALLGAQVMAEEAVAPARAAGVPLNIRCFADPGDPGTWVRAAFGPEERAAAIAVTGRPGLSLCRLEAPDAGPLLTQTALDAGLPLARMASDADALCLALRRDEPLPDALRALSERQWHADRAAALSVVGEGLPRLDAAARFSAALSAAGIRPLSLHMPPAGLYITATVPEDACQAGVRALYDAFIRD